MNINAVNTQYNNPPREMFKRNNNVFKHSSMNTDSVSFKAAPNGLVKRGYGAVTDKIALGLDSIGGNKQMQRFIDFLKDKNYQRHIVAAVSFVLSGFYMADTYKSKKIEKEQRMPLMVNQGLVTVASTIGGYTLDNYLDKKLNAFTEKFNIANITDSKVQDSIISMREKKEFLEKSHFDDLFKFMKDKDGKLLGLTYEANIRDAFEVDNGIINSLKKELKLNPENKTVKKLLESFAQISKKDPDRIYKRTQAFLEHMDESTLLKKMFSKQSYKTVLGLVTEKEKNLSNLMYGLKTAKSLVVFGLLYRFVAPVIATPFANSLSSKIEKDKKLKAEAQKN